MSDAPRVLFLAQCLPYPPHSGVRARTFNILKQLSVEFHVTLLAFARRGHQPDGAARRASKQPLAALLHHVDAAVPIPGDHSTVRRVWDHVRSMMTRRPYAYFTYESPRFRSQLRRLLAKERYDLVHLDSLDLYRWLPELPRVPVTCTHHSIESQLLRRHANQMGSRWLGRYLAHQADLLERVERTLCPAFGANVMMSETEAAELRALAPGSRTVVVPNGVDVTHFAPRPDAPVTAGRVVFVGDTSTFPNRDAVEYLVGSVWPLVRHSYPGASLALIGGGTHAGPGVISLGRVPDIRPHVREASCCVVPLRVGGGTRLKILDAWAMAKPVVSTTIGCEGLDAVDGENILIRDDAAAFAAAVVRVLSDRALGAQLGASGRAVVEQTYDWNAVGRELRASYWNLVGPSPALVAR